MTAIDRDIHRRFRYREPAELKRDIGALELAIPWDDDPGPLLEPLCIGEHTVPNRLAVQPSQLFLHEGTEFLCSRSYRIQLVDRVGGGDGGRIKR